MGRVVRHGTELAQESERWLSHYRSTTNVCGATKDVKQAQVYYEGRKWELDICPKCYKSRFTDLEAIGRKPTRKRRKTFEVVHPVEGS